ncbi:hypothetical protein PSACC_01458 [Paramicrosporidium saccamoebae]|uniref:Cyclin N-terminal domain-containing protein n=1 Tax=Paramicrosporidium saccamoebae TaxID=1246581 RepID=A0A2H9TLV1_9FUNG|nr:hypothetical protein PSACC_01458 [Paramicrosporidium saccamoebae]
MSVTKTVPITALGSLVYMERLASRISTKAHGNKETAYRVFITSLLLSTKFLQDGSIRNDGWSSSLKPWFSATELTCMERQLLQCIDYNLEIKVEDLENIIKTEQELLDVIYMHHALPTFAPAFSVSTLRRPAVFSPSVLPYFEEDIHIPNASAPPSPESLADFSSWKFAIDFPNFDSPRIPSFSLSSFWQPNLISPAIVMNEFL